MRKFKSTALAAIIAISPLMASSAFAADHYEFWNGSAWIHNGSVTLTGPTIATLSAGGSVPCTSTFVLTLVNGDAKVTAASFAGSATCNGITAAGLSPGWPVSNPVAIAASTSASLVISGVDITIPTPLSHCTGAVGVIPPTAANFAKLDNANPYSPNPPVVAASYNLFTFKAPLAGGCAVSTRTPGLTANKPLRASIGAAAHPLTP